MIDRSLEMGSSRRAEFPVVEMTLTCGTWDGTVKLKIYFKFIVKTLI